jgi:Putative zincin peptidase
MIDSSFSMTSAYIRMIPLSLIPISMWIIYKTVNPEYSEANFSSPLLIISLVLSIFVHEFLHGFIWIFTERLKFNQVQFGIKWSMITPYAHCKVPIDIHNYIKGALAPFLVLSIFPFLISLFIVSEKIFIFSMFGAIAALGDILIVFILLPYPKNWTALDHPTRVGCLLYPASSKPQRL